MFIAPNMYSKICAPAERDVSSNGARNLDRVSLLWGEDLLRSRVL